MARIDPRNVLSYPGCSRVSAMAILCLVASAMTATARADGDPASDYLLSEQAFVSPNVRVSSSDKAQLTALLTKARRRGYTIRVAIIQSRYDLGAVTVLDKKPRLYAHFLSQELRFIYKQRLLVVMPNGYGIADGGRPAPAEQAVLNRLSPAGTLDGGGLIAAALTALHALTAHAGVPIAAARSSGHTRITRNRIAAVSAIAALLLLGGSWIHVRRRSARR
jgi:hypothetical protein